MLSTWGVAGNSSLDNLEKGIVPFTRNITCYRYVRSSWHLSFHLHRYATLCTRDMVSSLEFEEDIFHVLTHNQPSVELSHLAIAKGTFKLLAKLGPSKVFPNQLGQSSRCLTANLHLPTLPRVSWKLSVCSLYTALLKPVWQRSWPITQWFKIWRSSIGFAPVKSAKTLNHSFEWFRANPPIHYKKSIVTSDYFCTSSWLLLQMSNKPSYHFSICRHDFFPLFWSSLSV